MRKENKASPASGGAPNPTSSGVPVAVSLFTGAGGASLGIVQAGFNEVLGVERDADAAATARAAGLHCVEGDVRDMRLYDAFGPVRPMPNALAPNAPASGVVPDVGGTPVDLLWASPPCQAFSTAGKRKGAKGLNGWPWTWAVVDLVKPTWLLAENVMGLTYHKKKAHKEAEKRRAEAERQAAERGETVDPAEFDVDPADCAGCYFEKVIIPELEKRFAHVGWRAINAADDGVPQSRRRVIIAAGPEPFEWPEPLCSGEALAVAKWRTWAAPKGAAVASGLPPYWPSVGLDAPVGKPSRAEARWLKKWDKGERGGRFALRPWRTVRQALGLGLGVIGGMRNSTNNPTQERNRTTDEPSPTLGGAGNMILQREDPSRGWEGSYMDDPSPSVRNGRPSGGLRVIGGGHNPNHSGDKTRNLRDLTDTPSTTIAAQYGGGAGNAGPFVVQTDWREDPKHPTVTPDQPSTTIRSGGDGHAAPPVWLHTNQTTGSGSAQGARRRRLTPAECAALQDFPTGYPLQGTKTKVYKQVGNAVPPTMARRLAEAVRGHLERAEAAQGEGAHTEDTTIEDTPIKVTSVEDAAAELSDLTVTIKALQAALRALGGPETSPRGVASRGLPEDS